MIAAKAMIGLGASMLFAAQAGAGAAGTPVTVENVALTFSGLALIWFGATMLKVRDTVAKLQNKDQRRRSHIKQLRKRYHRIVDALLAAKIPIEIDGEDDDVEDEDE